MPSKKKITKPSPTLRKTALTFQEQITAAHLHYVQGLDQHVIAFAMGVNQGRIGEACMAVRRGLLNAKLPQQTTTNGTAPREAKHVSNDDDVATEFSTTRESDGPNTKAGSSG